MSEKEVRVDCVVRQPIVAGISEFKGVLRLDVRHHYEQDGDLRPTKRGVNVPLDDAMELVVAIEQLEQPVENTAVCKHVDVDVREPLHVSVSVFKNEWRLDVRHYYNDHGQWKPGQKGVNLPWVERDKLLAALYEVLA